MSTKITELYGLPTTQKPTSGTWVNIITDQQCPYLGRKCLKNRKSEPEVTIGTCSVRHGKSAQPVMICPVRLLERRQIFEDCKELLTLHQAGNEWHIISELEVPGGSVDYCLASVRKKKVVDFIGIELQTLDSTGTIWPERQKFLQDQGLNEQPNGLASEKPFGMNWKMTAKTILLQLHHKIRTFEHLSKKLVLVLQDRLLTYMKEEFTFDHVEKARQGDSMHFHSYSLDEEDGFWKLQLSEQLSTDSAGTATCLGLRSETKVELQEITARLESKLSNKTLFNPSIPPVSPSLVEEATEENS